MENEKVNSFLKRLREKYMGILYPLDVQLASQLKHSVLRLIKLKKAKKVQNS